MADYLKSRFQLRVLRISAKRSIGMWPDILHIISLVILKVGINQQQSVFFNTSIKMKELVLATSCPQLFILTEVQFLNKCPHCFPPFSSTLLSVQQLVPQRLPEGWTKSLQRRRTVPLGTASGWNEKSLI